MEDEYKYSFWKKYRAEIALAATTIGAAIGGVTLLVVANNRQTAKLNEAIAALPQNKREEVEAAIENGAVAIQDGDDINLVSFETV